jgi:hypothetical protein
MFKMAAKRIGMYRSEFALVNKSYDKDLRWSVALYRSWFRTDPNKVPFYVIVPQKDIRAFSRAFAYEMRMGQIGWPPYIMAEESLFEMVDVQVPADFDGWRVQQVVKLCFAKTGYARNYITVDSSMIFSRPLALADFIRDGEMCTAAEPTSKAAFFQSLRDCNEPGWLDGEVVNISQSFERMCEFMENTGADTNAYISCTGMFNSDLSIELDEFARRKGIEGYVGLLKISPYEFAWYGEFVFSQRRKQFRPHNPHIMTLAQSEEQADEVLAGSYKIADHHYGLMFQPPAVNLVDPEQVDAQLVN